MENWNINLKEENNMSPDKSIMYWQYALMPFNSPMMQINEHRTVKAAVLAKEQPDRSKHTVNEYQYIEGIYNYLADPRNAADSTIQTGWMYQKTFGTPNSGAEALDHYYTNDQIIMTPLKAASTPTMSQKMPTLTKLEKVLYTKMILGEADGADFDKFVEDWKRQGGDEILKELNAQQ